MASKGKVKVGIIGSQFEADIHAESFKILPDEAEVVAVASPTPGNAAKLAKKFNIPNAYTDYREMLKQQDIEMVTITAPNRLHCQMTVDIANSGKHVVCEKPLCMTLEEADVMIDTCKKQGVLLMYAEELYFTPKYVKAKEMADQGAFGNVYEVKQSEKHFGPHAPWFWDVNQSGGGVFMDMGCHGIAFVYWFLNRPSSKRSLPEWALLSMPIKQKAMTTAFVTWSLKTVPLVLSKTAGPAGAAWMIALKSMAPRA